MEPAATLSGLECVACGATIEPTTEPRRCPDCGRGLLARYDHESVAVSPESARGDTDAFLARTGLAPLLGLPADPTVRLGQGETPLLEAPSIADDLGIASVFVKDEGQNPTGELVDREIAHGVGAARASGAAAVALPTMGNAGQAAALAAARADLDSHSFVPSRTPFVNKAMINVHGGDMTVVEGRYRDAAAAYREAMATESWYPLAPVETPWRVEGAKPVAYEIAADRNWVAPDWVVVPTGQITALVGIFRGFQDLEALGLIDRIPRLVAAQSEGCAPLPPAMADDLADAVPVKHPDTVVGPLEIPEPDGGSLALSALRESDGRAAAVPDAAILSGAQTLAESGLPASVTGGSALAAARELSEAFDAEDAVVLVNPVAGSKEADLMRSHLMSQGR